MFKVQKCSKDIVKIVHVISVVQPYCYEATRIYLCTKKTKIKTLFNYFFNYSSVFNTRSQEYIIIIIIIIIWHYYLFYFIFTNIIGNHLAINQLLNNKSIIKSIKKTHLLKNTLIGRTSSFKSFQISVDHCWILLNWCKLKAIGWLKKGQDFWFVPTPSCFNRKYFNTGKNWVGQTLSWGL